MFQSRWGFHPCDYTTYRKLKFLHGVYQRALRMARAWERWKRKDPQNRVMRRRIRNEKGQTIGYEPPVPLAEPSLCPVFSRKVLENRHVDKKGNFFRDGFPDEKVVTDDLGIVSDYMSARMPVEDSAAIKPLRVSAEAIETLCEQAQAWLEERNVK
jgi:hypothetical protein